MLADNRGKIDPLPGIEAVDVLLEPGDLVIMHPFLIHGSQPNTSQDMRRLFLQGYTVEGVNSRLYPGCGAGVPRHSGGSHGH